GMECRHVDLVDIRALHAMGEQGGWPLTMFLTPDGKPFWGGTYFPREARYGRPGFVRAGFIARVAEIEARGSRAQRSKPCWRLELSRGIASPRW
ncbi:DUF255 domain-containing protein, partial [Mesorhizobium sp. M00.F.Ca.ET.217.01.1.1]|uniref:DUF255 domain-containing protein n=1 Tax=Mesorhizobium sp. M00.F.Ca.ET.217.01.1.1 TaxID=2500529 RepID=UPI001091DACF